MDSRNASRCGGPPYPGFHVLHKDNSREINQRELKKKHDE
jgi:hypothetical protein